MLEVALKLLEEITSRGFKAYIVGGFVRDYILGINSNDIDITTSATPKDIKEIFDDSCLPSEDYGSVTVIMKGIRFEITTFRKEIGYIDNRRPAEIKYIDDLYEDLLRRDFTINTICMDEKGNIVDLLNGQEDLKNGVIKTVGIAKDRFEEDVLRILRAVRFATILDFRLDNEVIEAIKDRRELLSSLSYNRKKEELDKIFGSSYANKGIELLLGLGLDKYLELDNLSKVKCTSSLIGVWTVLDVMDKEGLTDVVIVVTRYFGGILLGTGGLVRAYSKSVRDAIINSDTIEIEEGYLVKIEVSYDEQKNLDYILKDYSIINKDYMELVTYDVLIPKNKLDILSNYSYQIIKEEFCLLPMEDPFSYVKGIQKDFDGSKIEYSDEYYEILGIER